jgi:hypothetical protein
MNPSSSTALTVQVLTISRGDRWLVSQRLRDLGIASTCTADGCLRVEIDTPAAIYQLRSVIQHMTAPREALLDWLERCWQTSET